MLDEARLKRLVQKWEERLKQGESISCEELCRREDPPVLADPALLAELARRIKTLQGMRDFLWGTATGDAHATTSSLPPGAGDSGAHAGGGSAGPPEDTSRQSPGQSGQLPNIPGYELLGELGRGGMAIVYKAQELALNRLVAIKVLVCEENARPDLERRFLEEVHISSQLQHPSIVPVHQLGKLLDRRPFFVMKLVKGRTLDDLLGERGDCSAELPRFLAVFEQVCQTLAYAHSHRVIHRDLKPSNIMVGAFGEVQVMDWGLAKMLDSEQTPAEILTAAKEATVIRPVRKPTDPAWTQGQGIGTPAYLPPEQAGGQDVDERCDVFSLGGILCVILTGKPPYDGLTQQAAFYQALQGDLTNALARLDACGADAELVQLARSCLAKRPEDRPANAQCVADAVGSYLKGIREKLRRAEIERATADGKVIEERKRRRLTALLAVVVLGMVLLAGAGWLWWKQYQAQNALQVNRALAKAETLREQAKAVEPTGLAQVREAASLWRQALKAAEQAEPILAAGPADDETRQRVQELVVELRARAAEADSDRRMLEELEAAGDLRANIRDSDFLYPRLDVVWSRAEVERYAVVFREHGIDVLGLKPAEAAERIRQRSIQAQLIHYLDNWLMAEADRPEAKQLFEVAHQVDPDSFPDQIRTALLKQDRAQMKELAAKASAKDLPPSTLHLLANGLKIVDELEEAVVFLKEAQKRYPSDFWINQSLGALLFRWDPSRALESASYSQAALAVRPDSHVVLDTLAMALSTGGRFQEALVYFRLVINRKDFLIARLRYANALAQSGDMAEAEKTYRKVTKEYPNFGYGHYYLGRYLAERGRDEEAEKEYRILIGLQPGLPYGHFGLAELFAKQGKADEAMTECSKATISHPSFADLYFSLSLILADKGALEKADTAYQKAVTLRPNHPDAQFYQAFILIHQKKFDAAVRICHSLIEKRPKFHPFYQLLGIGLWAKGQSKEALVAFRTAVFLDPNPGDASNGRGDICFKEGNWEGAITAYKEALRLKPDQANFYSNLGIALLQKGSLSEALAECKKAVKLAPRNAAYNEILGRALSRKNEHSEAIIACQKAIDLEPNKATHRNQLGNTYFRKGDLDEAIKVYRKAIELKDDEAEYHDNLANTLRLKGLLDKAITAHREAVKLQSDNPMFHYHLGRDLLQKGLFEESVAWYERAIELQPKHADAYNELGIALLRMGKLDQALAATRRALELKPANAVFHDNLGQLFFDRRQLGEAIEAYQMAVKYNPEYEDAYFKLGNALGLAGRFEEALKAFRKGQKLYEKRPGKPYSPHPMEKVCKHLAPLEGQLPDIVAGKVQAGSEAERCDFASLCYYKQHYRASARFFSEAFAAQPPLADEPGRRYVASCAAARAASGQGVDTVKADDADRDPIRRQALKWLRSDLEVIVKKLASSKLQDRKGIREALVAWQRQPAFAGLRDPVALANLPAAEQKEWKAFWDKVATVFGGPPALGAITLGLLYSPQGQGPFLAVPALIHGRTVVGESAKLK